MLYFLIITTRFFELISPMNLNATFFQLNIFRLIGVESEWHWVVACWSGTNFTKQMMLSANGES